MTALWSLLLIWSGLARAHGGFPWATDVSFPPDDPEHPVVVTTFGLLAQEESGEWGWVCEEVVGTIGMTAFVAVEDGVWLAGGVDGIYRSADRCSWSRTGPPTDDLYVTSFLRDAYTPGRLWATTGTGDADNALFSSDDNGLTWQVAHSFGSDLTLRMVIQDPDSARLAALSWRDGLPSLWLTEDRESWTEIPLTVNEDALVYPLAFDDEGRVWLHAPDPYEDTLMRVAPDGTAETILVSDYKITAFDLGPGETVVYGTQEEGLHASLDGGASWTTADAAPVPNCLRSQGDTRWICAHNWSDEAAVLSTPRQGTDPAEWEWQSELWFGDVHHMQTCDAESTTATVCGPLWETVAASSGLDLTRYEPDTGGTSDKESGCGCSTAPGSGRAVGIALLAAISAAAVARRTPKTVA